MKKRSRKKILYILITFLLIGGIIGSNYIWYRIYKREQEKLKYAIIPTLTNDYYSNRVAIINNTNEWNQIFSEYKENQNFIVHNDPKDVPLINQNPDYPNGCEAAAATMLLNYYGINITLQEFIENYLMKETVYEKNGKRYGPNPASYYAGDPKDEKRGWGCFEPVIANAIQEILNEYKRNHEYVDVSIDRSEGRLGLNSYASIGEPIIIWTTTDYGEVSEVYEWLSYDSKNIYTYPKNSHVIVITGVDEFYYYINDPLKDEKNIPIEREKLEKSFDSMGRQMIGLSFYDFSNDLDFES